MFSLSFPPKKHFALKLLTFIFSFFLLPVINSAQTSIKKEVMDANPVKQPDTISFQEKKKIHQAYLANAIETKNVKQEFYGHLFLWSDFFGEDNFEEATRHLILAEAIIKHEDNAGWQGAVHIRRATIAYELNQYEPALKDFKATLGYCIETKDSACIGETLEEIGIVYHRLKKYDSADHYFKMARPLLQKFAGQDQLGIYYNNYGNMLADKGDFTSARQYIDSSIAIVMAGTDLNTQMKYKNNLASLLIQTGDYDKAIAILQQCIEVNEKQGWYGRLVHNYGELCTAFEKKGNYQLAYKYGELYHAINDSLIGADVQLKIAGLTGKFEMQGKELTLKKNQLELELTKRTVEKRTWSFLITLLIMTFGLLLWTLHAKRLRQQHLQSRITLAELIRILITKNTDLAGLEEKIAQLEIKTSDDAVLIKAYQEEKDSLPKGNEEEIKATGGSSVSEDFEKNIYNQRILTAADWSAFKIYFEKAYPGYLLRLRSAFSLLSEAEERLFLFIKLNLTNKEAAAILGISTDSVKKTRSRLKKRLGLEEKIDLDGFVHKF